jgi:hypothetical protein
MSVRYRRLKRLEVSLDILQRSGQIMQGKARAEQNIVEEGELLFVVVELLDGIGHGSVEEQSRTRKAKNKKFCA